MGRLGARRCSQAGGNRQVGRQAGREQGGGRQAGSKEGQAGWQAVVRKHMACNRPQVSACVSGVSCIILALLACFRPQVVEPWLATTCCEHVLFHGIGCNCLSVPAHRGLSVPPKMEPNRAPGRKPGLGPRYDTRGRGADIARQRWRRDLLAQWEAEARSHVFRFFSARCLCMFVCVAGCFRICVCVDKCFRMCVSSAQGWRWDDEHRCWHAPEAQAGGGHSRPRVVVCVCVGLLQAILLNYNSINVYATGRGEPAFRLSVCSVVPVSDACCMMCGLLRAGPSIFPASSVVRMSIW